VNPVRVLVIDDHPIVCESLARMIDAEGDLEVVGTASKVDEAHRLFRKTKPDVLVVDIALADAHGLELLQNLLAEDDRPAAIVYSMYDERTYAERAIRSGALGYVMKNAPTRAILDAIRKASRGEYYLSTPVLNRILRSMSRVNSASDDSPFANLTDRELEVYQLLGQGLDILTIAQQLNLGRKTVETYRRRIKEKLELDTINELLQHAIQWTHTQSRTRA